MHCYHGNLVFGREGQLPGNHLKEQYSQRVEITTGIGLATDLK